MRTRPTKPAVRHLLDCAAMAAGLGLALALALLIDSCVHGGSPAWGEPAFVGPTPDSIPAVRYFREAGPLPHVECKRADVSPMINPLCCWAKLSAATGERWEPLGCIR